MIQLYEQMQQYQFDQIDPDKPLDSHIRTLTDEDVDRCDEVFATELNVSDGIRSAS
jgi:hypothetical protein